MAKGINPPSLGCREINGRFEKTEVTFTVWVAK
jgi:hypothetical protein